MMNIVRNRHFYYMLVMDAVTVVVCFYLSFLIRFEFSIPRSYLNILVNILPYVLVGKLLVFSLFNLYRGMWRYTSLVDIVNVFKAVFTSSFLIILGILMVHRFHGYPRSVFLIDILLTFVAIGGIRVAIRVYFARSRGFEIFPAIRTGHVETKRLLIIGSGDAGEKVLREILDNPGLKFEPVGILDDDLNKQDRTIHGIPVLGTLEDISRIIDAFDEILIAIPSGKGEEMRRIVESCKRTGKPYKTVPSMGELIDGINAMKIPSFTVMGEKMVDRGVLATRAGT